MQAISFLQSNGYLEIAGDRASGKTRILAEVAKFFFFAGGRLGVCSNYAIFEGFFRPLLTNRSEQYLLWYNSSKVRQHGVDRVFRDAQSRRLGLVIFDEMRVSDIGAVAGFEVACAYTPEVRTPPNNLRERVLRMIT